MNLPELCRSCPSIAEMKAAAVSVAQHESRSWYAAWLADSTIFASAIRTAAETIGMEPAAIRETVLAGLLDVYFTAKRRRAKEASGNERRKV